jgi:iron complex transport system ATP-binding protein
LDLLAREQLLATVQQLARSADAPTIVLITHHVEELPPARRRCCCWTNGRVAASGQAGRRTARRMCCRAVYRCPRWQVTHAGGRHYLQVHPAAWERF